MTKKRIPVRKKVQCLGVNRDGHRCSNWADATIGLCNPVHRPTRATIEVIRSRKNEGEEALSSEFGLLVEVVQRILGS